MLVVKCKNFVGVFPNFEDCVFTVVLAVTAGFSLR